MPSLRKRVSSYFRQLSFHNEPRDKRHNVNENTFVTKYLQGHITLKEGPQIIYGKSPTDLPNYELGQYENGSNTVIGCYSGPKGGLTTVKRTEKHLSVLDADIDFIDTHDDETVPTQEHELLPKLSPNNQSNGHQRIDNTTMVIKVAGHEYCVTNKPKRHSKSHSLGSISDFNTVEIDKTRIEKSVYCDIIKKDVNLNEIVNSDEGNGANSKPSLTTNHDQDVNNSSSCNNSIKTNNEENVAVNNKNYALAKSRSEGNHHANKKKRGRIIKIDRPNVRDDVTNTNITSDVPHITIDDSSLPEQWNRKSNCVYGLSDSLYDRNQVTNTKNGDPIADCFGVIARNDSAILAVADGVNWGEKASIAAKSAVHGCLHYLNKTIFNDTKPFETLTKKTDIDHTSTTASSNLNPDTNLNLINNTREVFVCLLRAFNCAHDLILENDGMLTTLTVAVVLPIKQKTTRVGGNGDDLTYVCCVCNVGDTLAYVYSQKYGVRELTKGSHDVTSNRDMRDALGALGPVDGINPELSNLTLSITTLQKGDIVMVASDGLTDNFDPNVCRFTVNTTLDLAKQKKTGTPILSSNKPVKTTSILEHAKHATIANPSDISQSQKPPIKPPRRSKNGGSRSGTPSSVDTSRSVDSSRSGSSKNSPKTSVKDSGNKKSEYDHPLVAHFMRENSVEQSRTDAKSSTITTAQHVESKRPSVNENKASSLRRQASSQQRQNKPHDQQNHSGYTFLKSKTSLDLRSSNKVTILRNDDGIPYVTPIQRYEIQLLLMEDILKNGISGKDTQCANARLLCENLISFTMSITSAKRRTLEDSDLYFEDRNGVLVEVSNQEKKRRRKKALEKVQSLPGKLDHVTVVAYNVGNVYI